ncbi:MAG TPA: hypothetical protein VKF38_07020 [Anaerolineaceae bacterium]|nr:hypothetical protein [Anaerolineaceae bacterium]
MPTTTRLGSVLQVARSRLQSILKNWRLPRILLSILLLGLVQGIIFAAIIPPWWHNDEPGHFEYAWLVANLPTWPKAGQYDQTMRQQMAISMANTRWYQVRGVKPDLSGSAPIPIGVTQTGKPPLYYFIASLPLRVLHQADINLQYYAARSISFVLYLLVLVVIWYALGEILRSDHPLRWMVPTFLALLPGFIDAMTAINNDVAAVLAASLFFWASLRLIKKGFSIGRLFFLAISLILCYLSKDTAQFTFLLTPLVLLLGFLRGRFTWVVITLCVLSTLIFPLTTLEWGAPLGWYQTPAQISPLRSSSSSSPLGSYVFQISYQSSNVSGQISQFIPPDITNSISDHRITLGGWFWADPPTQIMSPSMVFSTNNNGTLDFINITSPQTPLALNTRPTFYRFVIQAPPSTQYASIIIPYILPSPNGKIFIDGLVLAPGEYSNVPPHFSDPNGTQGTWDGQKFLNIIRNGSAEQDNLRFQPWAQDKLAKLSFSFFDPPFILSTLLDRHGIGWYYRQTLAGLFRTFWTSLAADRTDRPVITASSSYMLMLLTFLGVAGALLWMWRKRKTLQWDILFFLGVSLFISGTLVVFRGISGFEGQFPIISWARYIDPAILPIASILCAGWLEWLNLLKTKIKFTNATLTAIFIGGLLGISALAMADAIQVIHPDWWRNLQPLIYLLIFQIISIQAIILYGKTRFKS